MKSIKKSRCTVVHRQPGRPGKDEPAGALLLLRAAQSAFASHGFKDATLRKIATDAGVDPALAIHRFGSKEALWEAVIDRQALYLKSYLDDFKALQSQTEVPVRARIETAFRKIVAMTFGEPECGMLIARISSERGAKLDLLVERLLRPTYDALYPLFVEAAQAKAIKTQQLDLLYFMILNAVTMSVSYRHVLGYFNGDLQDSSRLEENMTEFLIANFLHEPAPGLSNGDTSTQGKKAKETR
ncbi:MAG: TetR/AcrR family transcriptional regulator [Terracidiphilus sp.]|nr:TetR/AcrR family transcriptional regulator [Terracidiphilus sp.]MDR3776201.1 TetR/AcrR family transcriptional regulator [Terracidiphilus sp.]